MRDRTGGDVAAARAAEKDAARVIPIRILRAVAPIDADLIALSDATELELERRVERDSLAGHQRDALEHFRFAVARPGDNHHHRRQQTRPPASRKETSDLCRHLV